MASLYDLSDFEKCINIARTAFESGDREKAERFAQKAERMQPASETARVLLARIRASDVQNVTNNNVIHPWSKPRQNPQYVNFSAELTNRSEAEKCLDMAENALLSGNLEKAERLIQKAIRMCPTQRATELLNQINNGETNNTWNRRSTKHSRQFSNVYNNDSEALKSMANKEDADKCIEVAQTALNSGNLEKAERFLEKAQRFAYTARGRDLLQQVSAAKKNVPNGDGRSFGTPRIEQRPKVTVPPKNVRPVAAVPTREPSTNSDRKRPLYTDEQVAAIRRVKSANNDYEILGVPRQCSKSDVKKAYRRLTTLLHPDKNKAAGAKEAFMMITDAMDRLLKLVLV